MKPSSFTYHRPQTVEAALAALGELRDAAKLIAGGQSLGPMLNMRLARPQHLVDLNDLIELDYVRIGRDRVEIGAMTRHHRVATSPELRRANPLLAFAVETVGHYAIRQRGTFAGSLVHADPAAQIPLIAATLDAEVLLRSKAGDRTVRARDFLQSVMTVDLRDDELVIAVRLPALQPGEGWGFELFSRRRGDFAIVAVAATVLLDASCTVERLRLSLGGVGAVPLSLDSTLRERATGAAPDEAWRTEIAERVAIAIEPEDDAVVPADFRRDLARTLTERALSAAVARTGRPAA